MWVVPGQYCWFLAFSRAFRSWLVPFCISLAPCDICLSSDWLLRLLQLYKNSLYTTRMRRKTEAGDYDCKLYKRRVTRFFETIYLLNSFVSFLLLPILLKYALWESFGRSQRQVNFFQDLRLGFSN